MFPLSQSLSRLLSPKKSNKPGGISSSFFSHRKKYQVSVPENLQEGDDDEVFLIKNEPRKNFDINGLRPTRSSPTILISESGSQEGEGVGLAKKGLPGEFAGIIPAGLGFPPPEDVSPSDPIFRVVKVDVHFSEFPGTGEIPGPSKYHTLPVQGASGNGHLAVAKAPEEFKSECPAEVVATGSQELNYQDDGDSASIISSIYGFDSLNLRIPLVTSKGHKGANGKTEFDSSPRSHQGSLKRSSSKVVGYFDSPEFVLKYTISGKVWTWDRSDDLLIIKDDGRITSPISKSQRSHKSCHHQMKSSMGKLYDIFFPKKDKEMKSTKPDKWATNSLDRKDCLKKNNTGKQGLQVSFSTSDVVHYHTDDPM